MDAFNFFRSDDIDDTRDFAGFGCPFNPPAPQGPVVTDPTFLAVVDTAIAMIDAALAQVFFNAAMQAAKQVSERRPYIAAVGSRNALRHSLHQTGVLR